MRPTIALLRAAAPTRALILGVLVVIAPGARLMGLGHDWDGSEEQAVALMLIELLIPPVFAAMLGSALVRGEQAPWAWGLARPISRTRIAATTVVADALLFVAIFVAMRVILGEAHASMSYDVLLRTLPVPHDIAAVALVVIAYLAAAIGTGTGRSTLRALPVGLAVGLVAMLVAAVVVWLDRAIALLFVVEAWPTPENAGLLDTQSDGKLSKDVEWIIAFATIAIGVIGGFAHGVVRALARVPAPLARRELVAVFGLWIVGTTLVSWSLHSRSLAVADAPRLALRGDASLTVRLENLDTHEVVLAEADCATCFARAAPLRQFREPVVEFTDVEPGHYRLCAEGLDPSYNPTDSILERGGVRWYTRVHAFESCIEIDLVEGANEVGTGFDPPNSVRVVPELPRGRERQQPFEGLLLAEIVLRATQ